MVLLLLPFRRDFLTNALAPLQNSSVKLLPRFWVLAVDHAHDINVELDVPAQFRGFDPVAQVVGTTLRLRCISMVLFDLFEVATRLSHKTVVEMNKSKTVL